MITKSTLKKLYIGKSMTEIARELKCSVHTVVYWMEKHGIQRRSISEAMYLKANPTGDPYKIRNYISPNEKFLLGLAIGIYLGEGNKTALHSLRVTNSNPIILRVFLHFLDQICNFNPVRISYSIVCFNDTNPETARRYWAEIFHIIPEKFGKITQIPKQSKGTYRKKSLYGVCTVQANNVKLRNWFFKRIDDLDNILPR